LELGERGKFLNFTRGEFGSLHWRITKKKFKKEKRKREK
jgi:hypothetical protein